ncbi:MAG: hypothetical protein KDA44_22490 [Planctomycetales bacterium]|nr:hypothetical protein [Planctomycetales bacterium]
MRHVVPLVAILFAASVVAFPITPADPISYWIGVAAICIVAAPAYLYGCRIGGGSVADADATRPAR